MNAQHDRIVSYIQKSLDTARSEAKRRRHDGNQVYMGQIIAYADILILLDAVDDATTFFDRMLDLDEPRLNRPATVTPHLEELADY